MKRALLALLVACGGGGEVTPPPTDQADLLATLEVLSAMGEKAAGTPAGAQAADYIAGRFRAIGLTDVHFEEFTFPQWKLVSKSLSITIDGVVMSPGFDVFEASGGGQVTSAEIVNVETATAGDLAGKNLTGKIALVVRDPSFHRSAQYQNVMGAGAAGMLYLSIAPKNLRQVGSVRFGWEDGGTIPALTVGADDGKTIKDAVIAGKNVRATVDVKITSAPGTGKNVVGRIAGERKEQLVLGAHFDTWFSGSSDNGGGVAELLAIAERRKIRGKPKYTLVFVAFDGEEIGLYGGYDYLRKHDVVARDPILAVINFESPSAHDPDIAGLVHSNQPKIDEALQKAHLRQLYAVYAGLEVVAQLFGGIIPTDIQGMYRGGIPTVTTAVTNPYYHTAEDTPDKVDLQLLAESTDAFDEAISNLLKLQIADYEVPDPQVWTADVTTSAGATFVVEAQIRDGMGAIRGNVAASASVLYDDFLHAQTITAMTDANGKVRFEFPADVTTRGSGQRFAHITAGPQYPLVEKIVALP
ncbi:MAG: M28 family peptidase [Myxococcota bacterium]|nr:M28 family peptidase [Myxococcota bacterium]